MRQVTTIKTYGTFEELTKERQAKELENYRDINVDFFDWSEDTLKEFTSALEILGFKNVKISYSGFWSQGDGASFTGAFHLPSDEDTLKMRLDKFKSEYSWIYDDNEIKFEGFLNFDLSEEIKDGEYKLEIYRMGSRYSHSNTITCDNDYVQDFARTFSDLIYKSLRDEYRYLTSDEQVKESLISNEVEFLISEIEKC